MARFLGTFLVGLAILSSCGPDRIAPQLAREAAEDFHAKYNASAYEALYDLAAQEYRSARTRSDFVALLDTTYQRLGRWISSSVVSSDAQRDGFGPTRVVRIERSVYARGVLIEHFRWIVRDGRALLADYSLESAR